MELKSQKRRRLEVPKKSKRRRGTMNGEDDIDKNVGDYLDFISHISKGDKQKTTGEEENSYLHDESLLLSPILTDYMNRSNLSSSTDKCDPNASKKIQFSNQKHLENDTSGNDASSNVSRGEDVIASSVIKENLLSVWQLDASTCPSLGLGSSTSADSSQNISDSHNSTRDILTSDYENSELSKNHRHIAKKCSENMKKSNNDHGHRNDKLVRINHSVESNNCATDGDNDSALSNNNESSRSRSAEFSKRWCSKLSGVITHAESEKGKDNDFSEEDNERGQASSHETEHDATIKRPQHNAENEKVDQAVNRDDLLSKELKGFDSWSTPSTTDSSTTAEQYSDQKEVPSVEVNYDVKGNDVEDNDDRFNEIGTANRFSTAVATPTSSIPHKKAMYYVQSESDDTQDRNQIMQSKTISRTLTNFVERLTPPKKSKETRIEVSPALEKSLSKYSGNNHPCDQSGRLSLQNDSLQGKSNLYEETVSGRFSIELSLTPALKRLRSRMMGNTCDGEIVEKEDCFRTPTNLSAKDITDRVNTPSASEKSCDLNLTPALQALKSRINLYSSDEDCSTPQSLNSTKSFHASSGMPRRKSPITPINQDDSYLEQPNDLSSAKKKLTAQSSALVERLRGAAQRRNLQLSRSRNSIVAREQKYLMKLETNDDLIHSSEPDSGGLHKKSKMRSPIMKTLYNNFKARPLPASILEGKGGYSGVPKVRKRPTTIPKSPMLGSRRKNSVKSSNNKHVPASTGMIISGSSRPISKTKKRIMSLPNTPNDVYKNKENEATKPILLSAESKVNLTLHSNHGKRNTAKKDTRSNSKEETHLGLHQVSRSRNIEDEENMLPFRLHSSIRAVERGKYDTCRALSEKKRQEQLNKERDSLIEEKHLELSRLKDSLR